MLPIVLALAAGASIASGCGGTAHTSTRRVADSSSQGADSTPQASASTTATAPALSRSQLIARADAICARVNTHLAHTTVHSSRELVQAAPGIAAFERSALAELKRLTPPVALSADWKTMLGGLELLAQATQKYGEYVGANQTGVATGFAQSVQERQRQVAAVAERDGFQSCGKI
jgi:hypothetical protein